MLSLLFLLLRLLCASALHVEMRGEHARSPAIATKRDHISGLENGRNLNYMVNMTLGGQPMKVVIDTGRYLRCAVTSFILHEMLTFVCLYQLRSLGFEYNSNCQ